MIRSGSVTDLNAQLNSTPTQSSSSEKAKHRYSLPPPSTERPFGLCMYLTLIIILTHWFPLLIGLGNFLIKNFLKIINLRY